MKAKKRMVAAMLGSHPFPKQRDQRPLRLVELKGASHVTTGSMDASSRQEADFWHRCANDARAHIHNSVKPQAGLLSRLHRGCVTRHCTHAPCVCVCARRIGRVQCTRGVMAFNVLLGGAE